MGSKFRGGLGVKLFVGSIISGIMDFGNLISEVFGKTKIFTILKVEDDQIKNVQVIDN